MCQSLASKEVRLLRFESPKLKLDMFYEQFNNKFNIRKYLKFHLQFYIPVGSCENAVVMLVVLLRPNLRNARWLDWWKWKYLHKQAAGWQRQQQMYKGDYLTF